MSGHRMNRDGFRGEDFLVVALVLAVLGVVAWALGGVDLLCVAWRG